MVNIHNMSRDSDEPFMDHSLSNCTDRHTILLVLVHASHFQSSKNKPRVFRGCFYTQITDLRTRSIESPRKTGTKRLSDSILSPGPISTSVLGPASCSGGRLHIYSCISLGALTLLLGKQFYLRMDVVDALTGCLKVVEFNVCSRFWGPAVSRHHRILRRRLHARERYPVLYRDTFCRIPDLPRFHSWLLLPFRTRRFPVLGTSNACKQCVVRSR